MEVTWSEKTGWLSQVTTTLKYRISALVKNANQYKTGITNNPPARASQYPNQFKEQYDEMIVLHRTGSDKLVRALEKNLVDDYWGYTDNTIGGGGGPSGEPPYYLYIVRGGWTIPTRGREPDGEGHRESSRQSGFGGVDRVADRSGRSMRQPCAHSRP